MNKAVFIDRDGTLIKDVPYNANPVLIEFLPGAIEALTALKKNKFLLILISNQSGIARGFFTIEQLNQMHEVMQQTLRNFNVQLDDIYYCPHHPEGKIKEYATQCECRKPKPGLILQAAKKYNIDLNNSWMVGDILNDVEAGNAAGCKTILLDNGNETEWILNEKREPAFTVKNWRMIAQTIVSNEKVILNDG
jgi:D-glycero-D-manno-heptose 1,7-bisphosphate phosphatase